MQYRDYGKTGMKVSAFGMGCMRLPSKGNEVDFDESIRMIRYAVDHGVNYFDTAFTYLGGQSEQALGRALEDGYRQKVYIATKQPLHAVKTEDDFRRNLETTLGRLGTDYLDVYFMHHMRPDIIDQVKALHMPEWFQKFKDEGLVKNIGLSYHGDFEGLKSYLDLGNFDMIQIQQNILDVDNQATEKAIYLAEERGLACVIMEPLHGGGLATAIPEVKALYDAFPVERSAVEWAFRHLYNYSGVSTILSGVSTMEQLVEDIEIFENALPGCMDDAEKELIEAVREAYASREAVPCTACKYCLPCPSGVSIPDVFAQYNAAMMMGLENGRDTEYPFMERGGEGYSACVQCGACEDKCPQEIKIRDALKKAHAFMMG